MNRFLLKNDTTENVSARVSMSPSDELGNLGHEGATVIEEGRLTTCLAPTSVALPDPTGHRSQCFELKDEGRYAIEINGVIQPYAFSPADLMDCFNGEHDSQIRFLACSENVCLNAIETASTGGVWGDATITINGITYPSIYAPGVDLAVKLILDGESHFIWNNKTTEFQRVEINNATLYSGDYGWDDNTNPTMKYDIENGTIKFCLAPAEAKPEIICDGATTEAYIAFNGWDSAEYDVEINGVTARVVVTTPSDIVSAYLESVPDANLEGLYASGGSSSTHTLYSTNETTDYRIRIMPISSENLTEEELIAKFNGNVWENPPQNPTFGYDTTTGEITFCLAHVVDDGMVDAEASGLQVLWTKTLTAGDEYGLTYSLDDGATQEQVTWTVPEGEMYLSHAYYNLFKQIPLFKSEDTPAGTQYAFTVELSPHSLAFDLNGNSRVYPDSTPVKVTVYPKPHATNAAYDKSLYDDYPDATIDTFISGGLLTS